MTDRTKAISEIEVLIEKLYSTKSVKEYSSSISEIMALIAQWSPLPDNEVEAFLCFSKILKSVQSSLPPTIQVNQTFLPATSKPQMISEFHHYIRLCFPLDS